MDETQQQPPIDAKTWNAWADEMNSSLEHLREVDGLECPGVKYLVYRTAEGT